MAIKDPKVEYKTLMQPDQVLKCFNEVKGARTNWEPLWDELAYYVVPLKEMYEHSSGEQKFGNLLDTTAMVNAELLAGALHSMLTSPQGYFFGLTSGRMALDQQDAVRAYIQDVTRILHDIISGSNFQTEVHELYLGLVGQGNACFLVEEDTDTVINCSTKPLKEVWFKENSKSRIDTIYREFKLDAKGMVDEFGLEDLPAKVKKAYKENKAEKWDIVHVVYPRKQTKASKKEFRFDIVSQYIFVKDKINLKIEGFNEMPFMTPRWVKMTGETYGRGPGEKALGPAKALNVMRETTIAGAQKVVDPPLQAPDDGFILNVNTTPGGITYYRAGSDDRIETVFNDSRIDFGYQAIEAERVQVREAFYADQLKLREGDRMTTVEVNERIEQGLRFMGPMLGRVEVEFLVPFVSRVYSIADRKGLLPEVPAEIDGVPLKIRYTSPMAMQQRMSDITNIRRTMTEVAPFMTLQPNLKNMFNGEEAVKYIASRMNFPQEVINTKEQIEALNKADQEAQQAAAQAEQQAMQADAASKTMGGVAKLQAVGTK